MSVDHEAIEEAKGKAELRQKVDEFVEMLRSKDMSVKVTSAAVTRQRRRFRIKRLRGKVLSCNQRISMARRLLRLFYSR